MRATMKCAVFAVGLAAAALSGETAEAQVPGGYGSYFAAPAGAPSYQSYRSRYSLNAMRGFEYAMPRGVSTYGALPYGTSTYGTYVYGNAGIGETYDPYTPTPSRSMPPRGSRFGFGLLR
jgi:hypothetical protein